MCHCIQYSYMYREYVSHTLTLLSAWREIPELAASEMMATSCVKGVQKSEHSVIVLTPRIYMLCVKLNVRFGANSATYMYTLNLEIIYINVFIIL